MVATEEGDRRTRAVNETINQTVMTVCIWNLDLQVVPDVWRLLEKSCRVMTFKAILKVRRVCQRDHRIRYEVDVLSDKHNTLLGALRGKQRTLGWYVQTKRYGRSAKRLDVAKFRLSHDTTEEALTLCSYNINGLKNKREDLEEYMDSNNIDLMGIQETRRLSSHWRLHFRGYNCVEVNATEGPGQRGIALAVRKGITAFPVGNKSMYYIFVRVFGRTVAKPFIVGTIYLPLAMQPLTERLARPLRKKSSPCERSIPVMP